MEVKDFSKTKSSLEIPDLLSIQLESFKDFLQSDVPVEQRKNEGLEALFRESLNISDVRKNFQLQFVQYEMGEPKYSAQESIEKMVSFTIPLSITLKLIKKESDKETIKDIVEDKVFLCDLPLMTESGTFIINGIERVVISQLHRSPGLYFAREDEEYSALLIPYRGAWAEFVIDRHNILSVILDRRRRINAATFFQAMGFSFEQIYKSLFPVSERPLVAGQIIAKTIYGENQVVYAETGETVSEDLIDFLKSKNITKAHTIDSEVPGVSIITKTFQSDKRMPLEEAIKKIYVRLRNIVPHSIEIAKTIILGMLFDSRRFDLGKVGRYKLNRRIGRNVSLNSTGLEREDFFLVIKNLLEHKENRIAPDDIDHLANRRVRRVGELLVNQFRNAIMQLVQNIRERVTYIDLSKATPNDLINSRIVANAVIKFFTQNQLSQFMEQTNPLTELTHKRRISALGPGGLTKDTAGFEVRDVHYSHYGRLCPIETPEGPNIGLIATVATYANIDQYGFIATPYWKVVDGVVTKKIMYLNPEEEEEFTIAQANTQLDDDRKFLSRDIVCRKKGDVITVTPDKVDYMDITAKQLFAPTTIMIPFLEHDDADRALMGANMQRQAVPLLVPEKPLVATGVEGNFAKASGNIITAPASGTVVKADAANIVLNTDNGNKVYKIKKYLKSNQYTSLSQKTAVKPGTKVKKGDLLADGPATDDGQLALGRNILVAFIPWYGYNYEDAIIVSERLIKGDDFTSVQLLDFEVQARDTKLGPEEITRDIPGVSEDELANLDEFGMIRVGAKVGPGDILVGRITPKGETEFTPEERLLRAIFGEKAANVRDTSLRVEPGVFGVVIDCRILTRHSSDNLTRRMENDKIEEAKKSFDQQKKIINEALDKKVISLLTNEKTQINIRDNKNKLLLRTGEIITKDLFEQVRASKIRHLNKIVKDEKITDSIVKAIEENNKKIKKLDKELKEEIERLTRGDELPHGVLKSVTIFIAQKRRLAVGDKMAGRHGNKGVVSKILPVEEMPYMEDGTPVDIILNPLGVPSRMNIGQILETHLGWAAKHLGYQAVCPVFEGASVEEIKAELKKAGLPEEGKVMMYDGRTGLPFEKKVVVGYMYMMKLIHMVDDKIHARSTGHYSLITQQPLGGKAQFGGQRFGEMEVWALEAYGAANSLQEMLTIKSDDVEGRSALYNALIRGENPPSPKIPASFSVLVKELAGLALELIPEKERK